MCVLERVDSRDKWVGGGSTLCWVYHEGFLVEEAFEPGLEGKADCTRRCQGWAVLKERNMQLVG